MSQKAKTTTTQIVLRIVIVLVILTAGSTIMRNLILTRPQPKKVPQVDKGQLVEVETVETSRQPVEVVANGQVIPSQQIALSAEVAGRVVWLSDHVVPGGRLRAGERVARIDARDYNLAVRQQVAQVDRANTELEVERNRKAIAEREWELLGGDKPANSVALRDPQLRTAEASVKAARSGLERAQLSANKTAITAPFNAVIQQKNVDIGQLVGPQSPLVMLIGTDHFWVQVSIPVDRLRWIDIPGVGGATAGSPATITQTAGSATITRSGEVVRLLGDLDPIGRMARVLVEIPDPLGMKAEPGAAGGDLPLLIGSYVQVAIQGRRVEGVVEITRDAVHNGDRVYIMKSDNTLEIRPVVVLWQKPDTVLIAEGLEYGDRVIVSPLAEPVAGTKLRRDSDDRNKSATAPGEPPGTSTPGPDSGDGSGQAGSSGAGEPDGEPDGQPDGQKDGQKVAKPGLSDGQ